MRKKRHISDTNLKCTVCGEKQTMFRQSGYTRTEGHVKTIYCFKCKKETEHVESKYGVFE